jgi:hypothetical protein
MTRVRISGWEEGLRKVALNKVLQRYLNISLAPAKTYVDRILSGEEVIVAVESRAVAETLVKEAGSLGALAEVVEDT